MAVRTRAQRGHAQATAKRHVRRCRSEGAFTHRHDHSGSSGAAHGSLRTPSLPPRCGPSAVSPGDFLSPVHAVHTGNALMRQDPPHCSQRKPVADRGPPFTSDLPDSRQRGLRTG